MHDSHWEVAGFLCRWCLLALAGAAVAAVLWAGVAGAVAGRGDDVALVFPDRIKPHDGGPTYGEFRAGSCRDSADVFISGQRGGEETIAIVYGGGVWTSLRHATSGVNRLAVKGAPYGPMAMVSREAVIVDAGQDSAMFAVDARIPLAASRRQLETLSRRIEALRKRGTVIFFDGSDTAQYSRDREAVAGLGLGLPVIGRICDKQDWPAVLQEIIRASGQAKGRITIITADGELARAAGADGLAVESFNLAAR